MNDKSDGYSFWGYITWHVVFGAAIFMWYGSVGINRIAVDGLELSFQETRYFFTALTLTLLAAGMAGTIKYFRTSLNCFVNVVTPCIVFSAIAGYEFWKFQIQIAVGLSFTLAAAYLALFYMASRRRPARSRRETRLRISRAVISARNIVVMTLVCALSTGFWEMNFGTLAASDISPASALDMTEEWTLEAQEETIGKLRLDIWAEMSPKEQMDILQTIVNIEIGDLGIPYEISVVMSSLDEETLGCYTHDDRRIQVNAAYLHDKTSRVYLEAILHEVRHAYQHVCWDLYMQTDEQFKGLLLFQDTLQYIESLENYQTSENGWENYYSQFCEEDAREYAENTINKYTEMISYEGFEFPEN